MEWKVTESEYLFNEPWLTVRRDKCMLSNGKKVPAYYVIEYPEWVNVFALTEDNKVLMVKQYRHGLGQVGIEIPGGVAEKGEDMQVAAKRELLEETGYQFEEWEYLGKVSANPSTTNNLTHMFLATKGKKVAEQNLDDLEELQVLELTIDEIKDLVFNNKIMQALHTTCIFYALRKLKLLS